MPTDCSADFSAHFPAESTLPRWPSRYWAEVTAHDFALAQTQGLAAQTIAVLPLGATEQHGPHLPLRVDTALAEGMVAAALAQLPAHVPALALPTQAIGLSGEHQAFAGTLSLQPATLLALWGDIGAGVARAGVKKLLLFNAHGGNVSSMDIVARQLRQQHGLQRGENELKLIMMCEIPSNAILAERFLEFFDGFSIGSNDLTQLTLGLDRDSGLVAHAFDERDPAVKQLLSMAIQTANRLGKYVGICGQGPSDHADFAEWLMDEGIQTISLNPDTVVDTWLQLAAHKKDA